MGEERDMSKTPAIGKKHFEVLFAFFYMLSGVVNIESNSRGPRSSVIKTQRLSGVFQIGSCQRALHRGVLALQKRVSKGVSYSQFRLA